LRGQEARVSVDEDELGREVTELLAWPLSQRISADDAAKSVADGIAQRPNDRLCLVAGVLAQAGAPRTF
jgi:hypothetical protein